MKSQTVGGVEYDAFMFDRTVSYADRRTRTAAPAGLGMPSFSRNAR